jgi:tRNA 5-methylaminomethyl-2-thiouridine biosynthesis bifunctional protein
LLTDLPLEPVRGQVTFAATSAASRALAANLCYGGYIGAARNGYHAIGATFQRGQDDTMARTEDDAANIAGLAALLPDLAQGLAVTSARAAVRCAARDRFPVAGAVEASRGLYVSTAHGSHGIVTTLAAADYITDLLTGSPWSLPMRAAGALSPARFGGRRS